MFDTTSVCYDTLKIFFKKREKIDALENTASLKTIILTQGMAEKTPAP